MVAIHVGNSGRAVTPRVGFTGRARSEYVDAVAFEVLPAVSTGPSVRTLSGVRLYASISGYRASSGHSATGFHVAV